MGYPSVGLREHLSTSFPKAENRMPMHFPWCAHTARMVCPYEMNGMPIPKKAHSENY